MSSVCIGTHYTGANRSEWQICLCFTRVAALMVLEQGVADEQVLVARNLVFVIIVVWQDPSRAILYMDTKPAIKWLMPPFLNLQSIRIPLLMCWEERSEEFAWSTQLLVDRQISAATFTWAGLYDVFPCLRASDLLTEASDHLIGNTSNLTTCCPSLSINAP